MRQRSGVLAASVLFLLGITAANAATFVSTLSGAAESPANASTASGQTTVIMDPQAHTLRVIVGFTGLGSGTTASHIHCCVAPSPPPATAGVATSTPSFVGFPLTVTNGSMDQTYNTLAASTYNNAFIVANGGTPAGAEAALFTGLLSGQAYLNIHTTGFPGGEIRGFLLAAPSGILVPTLSQTLLGVLALMLGAAGWLVIRRRHA